MTLHDTLWLFNEESFGDKKNSLGAERRCLAGARAGTAASQPLEHHCRYGVSP